VESTVMRVAVIVPLIGVGNTGVFPSSSNWVIVKVPV
jgi:hypothetical protein